MFNINPAILEHVFRNLNLLLNRDFLLDILTESEKVKAVFNNPATTVTPQSPCYLYQGKLLDVDGKLYVVDVFEGVASNSTQPVIVRPLNMTADRILCEKNTPILLPPDILANYTGKYSLETTFGRFLLNYTILVSPFGSLIPYINDLWEINKIESIYIFEALRNGTITVDQVKKYSRNLHFIGHFTELAVPSFSERSLTANPAILKRRDELLKEHAAEIAAGDAVVMSNIETELVNMDREQLKGDSSTAFYDYDVGKSYGVHRKSMYALAGIASGFGEDTTSFVESSLEDGWKVKDFATICNQIRAGSYARAKETAKGGEETKFLIRVFQNTQITEEDCGSTEYLSVSITRENFDKFVYRNIIDNGLPVTLSDENIKSYIGKTVLMRSPQHCHTKDGFCFTCMGELFRTINADLLTMAAIQVSRSFTIGALKKMHGSSEKKISITSLNRFVI